MKVKISLQRNSVKKPKLCFTEAADTVFLKLFKEEVHRSAARIKVKVADSHHLVRRDKLNIVLISLYVFAVDQSAAAVFGTSKIKRKILNAFYLRIKEEFREYNDFIFELSQKFGKYYRRNPEAPLLGLGLCFASFIKEKDKNDVLAAMVGTAESAKKIQLVTRYYKQLSADYRL